MYKLVNIFHYPVLGCSLCLCGVLFCGISSSTAIAQALQSKVAVTSKKKAILDQLDWPELTSRLTTNWDEAQVHVLPMMQISFKVSFIATCLAIPCLHCITKNGWRVFGVDICKSLCDLKLLSEPLCQLRLYINASCPACIVSGNANSSPRAWWRKHCYRWISSNRLDTE